jgi:hypothetical protein
MEMNEFVGIDAAEFAAEGGYIEGPRLAILVDVGRRNVVLLNIPDHGPTCVLKCEEVGAECYPNTVVISFWIFRRHV